MAPPTTVPRLDKLDPRRVGIDVAARVLQCLQFAALQLSPLRLEIPTATEDQLANSDIALTMVVLATYAQTGEGDPEDVVDQVQDIAAALHHDPDGLLYEDPGEPIALACYAATARAALASGDDVGAGQLASLAADHVRLLVRKGEIDAKDGHVSAAEAQRFLSSRGVPGFAAKRRR